MEEEEERGYRGVIEAGGEEGRSRPMGGGEEEMGGVA